MEDKDLTRQEEDLSGPEFAEEESRDSHDFGNWPELVGLVFTAVVTWLIFAFTG
ncbi:hypothetical protein [Rhodospirillum sp. A1_3_36]|uniref:hypothetical protein n=1 Tax=Rhodospirillum sp. A1_3_36 TaxID=3391666 RepID=UPI0039A48DD6